MMLPIITAVYNVQVTIQTDQVINIPVRFQNYG